MTRQHTARWVAIDAIQAWDKNPRNNDHAVDELAKSIKRFGWGSPIIARKSDGVVIAGHTRLKAAQRLKMDKVLVRYLDLDPAEAAALALADNKIGELADWDDEGLRAVLLELGAEDVNLDGLGFTDEELEQVMQTLPDVELTDDDDVNGLSVESDLMTVTVVIKCSDSEKLDRAFQHYKDKTSVAQLAKGEALGMILVQWAEANAF